MVVAGKCRNLVATLHQCSLQRNSALCAEASILSIKIIAAFGIQTQHPHGPFSPFLPFFNLYLHSSLFGLLTLLYCSEKHVALSIQIERTFDLRYHVLIYCVAQFGSVLHWHI